MNKKSEFKKVEEKYGLSSATRKLGVNRSNPI
jgi:hypothetical protein